MKYAHPLTGLPIRKRWVVHKMNGGVLLFYTERAARRWANKLAEANGVGYTYERLEEMP